MKAGITSLAVRSSSASRNILQRTLQLAHVQSLAPPTPFRLDSMFLKAAQVGESNASGQRAPAKQSFAPSNRGAPNVNVREQLKRSGGAGPSILSSSPRTQHSFFTPPLHNRSANLPEPAGSRTRVGSIPSSLVSLYGHPNSFKEESRVVDLTGPDTQTSKPPVDFGEDDFSDDENLDLDYEAPSALPALPSNPKKSTANEKMPPPPSSAQTEHIPWTSSPPSHLLPPQLPRTTSGNSNTTERSLKRESSGDHDSMNNPIPKKTKRRVLPQSFREPEDDDSDCSQTVQTPSNKAKNLWDATASAVKEQKKQLKTLRLQKQSGRENEASIEDMREAAKSHSKGSFAISLSEEQKHVLDMVVHQNQSVFFTGPAGTGKSVLMRAIITELKKKYAKDPERVAVTASTGLAACNIGGITLHSFSGIGLGKEDAPTLIKKIRRNPKAKNRWLRTKVLILDEVSMVDGELFDKLSQIGRTIRNNGRPFGGIQLVITGDFFQLPPVPDHAAKRETKFAFDAATWSTSIDHTIGLTQVFRQRDPDFARMLNEIRLGKISENTVKAFRALARPLKFNDGLGKAELFSTRAEVENSNERRLRELPGKVHRYDSMDTGDPAVRDKLLMNMMAPKSIELKLEAQVMLIKNLDESLVNGSLGKVIAFSDEKTFDMTNVDGYDSNEDSMAKAKRKLQSFSHDAGSGSSNMKYPVVQFMATDGTPRVILCQPEDWKVELPNGDIQAKRTQLPLILAWALSIHKAQGQTLERVKVNLGRVFEKGQAYVALSRATCQDGLEVLGFDKNKVMAHPRVISFYNKLYSAEEANGKKPNSVSDFVANRLGAPKAPAVSRAPPQVANSDDDEEAMASFRD
ncbi:hypothetical protein G7046_g1446 [Stylonectria norvegica]|nr:hypothetical protein G7046_g1446 [Stylonectria norvegica]